MFLVQGLNNSSILILIHDISSPLVSYPLLHFHSSRHAHHICSLSVLMWPWYFPLVLSLHWANIQVLAPVGTSSIFLLSILFVLSNLHCYLLLFHEGQFFLQEICQLKLNKHLHMWCAAICDVFSPYFCASPAVPQSKSIGDNTSTAADFSVVVWTLSEVQINVSEAVSENFTNGVTNISAL